MYLKRLLQMKLLFFVLCLEFIDAETTTERCTRNEDCRRIRTDDHVCVEQNCMKPAEYSKPCVEDNQCRHHLVPDTDDGTSTKVLIRCKDSVCSCPNEDDKFVSGDGGPSCEANRGGKKFGEECEPTDNCIGDNISCIMGTCSCNLDSMRFNEICQLKKLVGEECKDDRECMDEEADCKGRPGSFTCQCGPGYEENEKSCVRIGASIEQKDQKSTNWVLIGSIFAGTFTIAVVLALVVLWFCTRR